MPRANTRHGLLLRKYKHKLTRSVNAEFAVRQASRANASEGEYHNFNQIDESSVFRNPAFLNVNVAYFVCGLIF